MNPDNFQLLYEFVKKRPIKRILELGTGIGCSTAAMALALKDKGEGGEVHTVEQFEKCYKLAQELIPDELKSFITFHKGEPTVWQADQIPYQHFSTFKELPEGPWDLILVDGPGPFKEGDKYIDLPNGDVMKMLIEDKLPKGMFIAWDGRVQALSTLERYFGDNFYLVHPGNRSDFNVIERKDNPIQFSDVKLQTMEEMKYI